MFTGKAVHTWLQKIRNYLSGRTCDPDKLFDFFEAKDEEILNGDAGLMLDIPATHVELSRQLWALITAGLVKEHAGAKRDFSNVPRQDGFEAWRKLAGPINEDKMLIRKDLLWSFNQSRHCASVGDSEGALAQWATDRSLFSDAGGVLPALDLERLALIEMLPADMNTYITMRIDLLVYTSLNNSQGSSYSMSR